MNVFIMLVFHVSRCFAHVTYSRVLDVLQRTASGVGLDCSALGDACHHNMSGCFNITSVLSKPGLPPIRTLLQQVQLVDPTFVHSVVSGVAVCRSAMLDGCPRGRRIGARLLESA